MTTVATYRQFAYDEPNVITITAPPANGAIVVMFTQANTTTISSVTDSTSGTYTLDHSRTAYNGTSTHYFYKRNNINNAPTTVTVTFVEAAIGGNVEVLVFDGMATGTVTPVITNQADTSYSATQIASFTTSGANDIGVIVYSDSAASANTADTAGWAFVTGTTLAAHNVDLGAAGAKTASFTPADPCERRYTILTYAAAPSGGPTTQGANSSRFNASQRHSFGIRR